MRFVNKTLDGMFYQHPYYNVNDSLNPDLYVFFLNICCIIIKLKKKFSAYRHFLLQLNMQSAENDYFKRAVRQKGRIVFDINRKSIL